MAKKKKNKFPKRVFVFHSTDIGDDPILICAESPDEISEEYGVDVVGIYELVETGKFKIEKTVSSKEIFSKLVKMKVKKH